MVTVGKVPIEVVMNIALSFDFKNSILGTQGGGFNLFCIFRQYRSTLSDDKTLSKETVMSITGDHFLTPQQCFGHNSFPK